MGILSWFFPTDADLLDRARASMDAGSYEAARKLLARCKAPEAEALYDECSAKIDKADRASIKKKLGARGFHGWKVEVTAKGVKRRAEIEALAKKELAKAGVDLDMPDIDQAMVKEVFANVFKTLKSDAAIRLVPIPAPQAASPAKDERRRRG
jgi:hypothetical protein